MAVRRTSRRSAVRRTPVSQKTLSVGPKISGINGSRSALGIRLRDAAEVIGKAVRDNASTFSKQIPPSVRVIQGSETSAVVLADSQNARPIELGLRHPLFGDREHWYASKHVTFLENGADVGADKAAEAIAQVIDDWAAELGYK